MTIADHDRPTTEATAAPIDPWAGHRRDLERALAAGRWGPALMTVGWLHLAFFLVCQAIYAAGERDSLPFLAIWGVELLAVLAAMRAWLGRGWMRAAPLVALAVKIWITFLILSFNVASQNTLTGWALDWFKPVWATLSTFVFMMLAYLYSSWFFAAAVVMYLTGLLMVRLPAWNYLIYGASWCLVLQVIGVRLIALRRRLADS